MELLSERSREFELTNPESLKLFMGSPFLQSDAETPEAMLARVPESEKGTTYKMLRTFA